MADIKNIFITSRPGAGKTTAILKTVGLLDFEVHGFTTRELRQGRARVGFRIEEISGGGAVMAHVDFPGPVKVGKYGVDPRAVEAIGGGALKKALEQGTPAIVDEVGKMELSVPLFVQALIEVVQSRIPVLGAMHRGKDPVTDMIRSRQDTAVIELTFSNRNQLPQRLADMLRSAWCRAR